MHTLAIIVNYKCADLTLQAARSVLDFQSLGSVDVSVVDNSDDEGEADRLRRGLPSPVCFRVSPENIGFGRACNLAFEGFRGDAILLLNPDARLLAGCLKRLQETLFSREKTAAVSPQIYWDDALTFCLPPSCPPSRVEFQSLLDAWGPDARLWRLSSHLWRRYAIKVWLSQRPIYVRNLTGGLVLLKRDAVQKAGGLFDPRFFLYFEDTDLFIRIRRAGYDLAIEPRARAIHHYDQCGVADLKEKRASMALSLPIFLQKYDSRWARSTRKIMGYLPLSGRRQAAWHIGTHEYTAPFTLHIPPSLRNAWLFEWSPNPDFIPAAARWGKGPFMTFHERYWALLAPGRYFGRLGRPIRHETHFLEVSWRVGDKRALAGG